MLITLMLPQALFIQLDSDKVCDYKRYPTEDVKGHYTATALLCSLNMYDT